MIGLWFTFERPLLVYELVFEFVLVRLILVVFLWIVWSYFWFRGGFGGLWIGLWGVVFVWFIVLCVVFMVWVCGVLFLGVLGWFSRF